MKQTVEQLARQGVILVFQLLPRFFSLLLQAYSPMKLVVSGLLQTGGKNLKGKKKIRWEKRRDDGKKEETNFAYDDDVVHWG